MRRGKRRGIQGLYIRLIRDPVPAVVAFTKADLDFPHISESENRNYQYQDRTRIRAYAQREQLCCSLFRWEAGDVPAELVSGEYLTLFGFALVSHHSFPVMPQYGVLINNLIVTTHKSIMGFRTTTPFQWSSRGAEQRITPTRLVWPVALRASRDITIQASIEYVVLLSTLISFICFDFQYRTIS